MLARLEDAHYATRDNYNFTVRATDVFGNFADKAVTLGVEDSSLLSGKMEVIALMTLHLRVLHFLLMLSSSRIASAGALR